jgi:hypothetical protein
MEFWSLCHQTFGYSEENFHLKYLRMRTGNLRLFSTYCNVQGRSLALNPRRLVPETKSDSLEMLQYVHCADLITGTARI